MLKTTLKHTNKINYNINVFLFYIAPRLPGFMIRQNSPDQPALVTVVTMV